MPPKKRKQVTGGASPFTGDHTFVNKDASNIDTKDHYAAVSWHLMNRYEKWKKQEQAKKSKAVAQTPTSPSEAAPRFSTFTADLQTALSGSSAQSLLQPPKESHSAAQYPPEPWRLESVEQSVQTKGVADYPTYDPYLHGTFPAPLVDPDYMVAPDIFGQDQVADHSAHSLSLIDRVVRFVGDVVIPNTWPQETERARWMYEISRASEDVSNMYSDILFASASLCLYATLLASFTHDTDLASAACFWQMQAMNELRNRIQNVAGNHSLSTLRAMLKIFSAETALDNTSTARVHLKMLRSIIQSQGGIMLLDSWFRENLLAADCYFALECETRPLFTVSEWTPGPLSQPWRNNLAAAQVLDDHSPVIGPAVEHAQLRALITDLREMFQVERYIGMHDLQADDQLLRWHQLRKFDCINRLTDHQLNLKLYPHMYQKPKLHAAICAAIALMTAMILGSPEPIRFQIKLTGELETKMKDAGVVMTEVSILEHDSESSTTNRDVRHLILWMLHVGLLAEIIHMNATRPTNFKVMFEDMATNLDLQTKQEEQAVTRQFLFSPGLEEEIASGRRQRSGDTIKGLYEACGTSWRQPGEVSQAMDQYGMDE